MRRLFWMGVGAAGAVLAAQRLRAAWHRYTPEGVAEQVEQAGQGVLDAGRSALGTFRSAFAERQHALVDQLLVAPEGGDPAAVRRAPGPAAPAAPAPRSSAVPSGRVDDEDDLFDL